MKTPIKYLSALLLCLAFCQSMMGAEKRKTIEVTEGTDGWYRIMLPKETPADTLLCGVFFAQSEDARIITLINVYNRLKEKKITYESILRMEKESEKASETHYDTVGVLQFQGASSRPGGGGQKRRCGKQEMGIYEHDRQDGCPLLL